MGVPVSKQAQAIASLLSLGFFLLVSILINNIVTTRNHTMQKELEKLVKSLTTLSNLVLLYLTLTWGYAGLEFILRSLLQ